jgi:RNA polymerase sigma-70 factor (ECF subfamily)
VTATLEDAIRALMSSQAFDDAAAAALRGYGPEILGYLTSVLRDTDDADDAFSRFAEDLWVSMARFRGECSTRAWCYRLAWHAAAQLLREPYRRRRERMSTSEAARIAASVRSARPAHLASAAEGWIARARATLTPDEHSLLILRFDRNLSWSEVRDVLVAEGETLDEPTLRKRYQRIKLKLRQLARDDGLIDEDDR